MKVLVCGDRNWDDRQTIHKRLCQLPRDAVIIQGCANGADTLAHEEAKELKLKVLSFPAQWKVHGKKAGPIRNRQMLDEGPDLVIAFHSNLKKSKGTLDTVMEANRRGIPVEIISGPKRIPDDK